MLTVRVSDIFFDLFARASQTDHCLISAESFNLLSAFAVLIKKYQCGVSHFPRIYFQEYKENPINYSQRFRTYNPTLHESGFVFHHCYFELKHSRLQQMGTMRQ